MDKYGLTEIEKKMKLQQYNHAMFRNMLHYMDGVWEINLVDRTVVILESKLHSMLKNKLLQYDAFLNDYAQKIVSPEERKVWFRDFSVVALKALDIEKEYRFHFFDEHGISRLNNIYVTPAKNEDGEVYCIYVSMKNAELEKTNSELQLLLGSMRMMKSSYYRIGCIDLDRNSMETIEIAEDEKQDEKALYADYHAAIVRLVDVYVLAEYRSRLLGLLKPEHIREMFDSGLKYADVTYQRLQQGKPHWVRSELMPVAGYGDKHHKVILYVKNISAEQGEEEKLTQKLLFNNERKNLQLETVLGGISGGVIITRTDDNFSIEHISEGVAKCQGYTVDEFMLATHGNMRESIYEEDIAAVSSEIQKCIENGGSYAIKYRVKHKNGQLLWVMDNGRVVQNEKGEDFLYCLVQDISELENSTMQLNRMISMLNNMLESVNGGFFAYTIPEHKVLLINKETERMFGYCRDCDESFGTVMQRKVIPEDVPVVRQASATLQNVGDKADYDFRTRDRNGKLIYIHANTTMLEFEDGQRFILSCMMDTTELRQLTNDLNRERNQYRDALTRGSKFCITFDVTEGMLYDDSAVTQVSSQIIQGMGLELPIRYDKACQQYITYGEVQFLNAGAERYCSCEGLIQCQKDGVTNAAFEYYINRFDTYSRMLVLLSKDEENGHVLAYIASYDVTKEKKKELARRESLLEAYESANRANSAKSDFFARVSHDIRTPMNAILGLTAIAGTYIDDKQKVAECLDKITVSGRHLLGMINDILDMSKIESGKLDLQEEEFSLSKLIDNLVTMNESHINDRQHKLNVQVRNFEHEWVVGDSHRIQQVFMNLMGNAVQYTPDGGNIQLYISEKPSKKETIGCYEFIFQDNGIGMSKEFQKTMFEPFTRATDEFVQNIQGAGLGLTIVRNIVQMMDGDIQVQSEPGQGTRITVTIYLKLQDSKERINYDAFAGQKVLVADDDEIVCEYTCQILKELGIEGEWVRSGSEALEKITQLHETGKDYFAILVDWKMPQMNGIQTTKAIRETAGEKVPIIIISSYDWSDIELEARAAGANAFVSKSMFKPSLAYILSQLLESRDGEEKTATYNIVVDEFKGRRALVVEDTEVNAEVAGELLATAGFQIEYAKDGREAVRLVEHSADGYYDIVLMDVRMPVMDGYEATRAIRSMERSYAKRLPIFAMTANAFAEDIQRAHDAGMNEHIAKPLNIRELFELLRKWLV